MIKVVNKYKHEPTPNDVYIGRGSVLGNPFSHLKSSYDIIKTNSKEEAIEKYKDYFHDKMTSCGCKDKVFKQTVRRLVVQAKLGEDINLVCFCKPKPCHGDVIKEYIENEINNG